MVRFFDWHNSGFNGELQMVDEFRVIQNSLTNLNEQSPIPILNKYKTPVQPRETKIIYPLQKPPFPVHTSACRYRLGNYANR